MLGWTIIFLGATVISAKLAFNSTLAREAKWPRFIFFIVATAFLAFVFIEMMTM